MYKGLGQPLLFRHEIKHMVRVGECSIIYMQLHRSALVSHVTLQVTLTPVVKLVTTCTA
jgi:hypothetical protein